jgi:branched-chain amino acid transport system substrate-binding protein
MHSRVNLTRPVRRVAAFGVASLVLAACGSSAAPSSSSSGGGAQVANGAPIYIGYNGELTGPSAAFGVPTLHGVLLAIDQINNSGGINGRPVDITILDNAGSATKAVSLQNQIVSDSKNIAMLGLNFGADNKAALPVSDAAGLTTFTFDWTGLSYASPNRYAVTVDVVADNTKLFTIFDTPKFKNIQRAAVWASDDPVFKSATQTSVTQLGQKLGITPSVVYFPAGAADLSAQAEQLIQLNPQVVLDSAPTAANMVAPLKEAKRQNALTNTTFISSTFVIPGVPQVAGPSVTAGGIAVTLVDFTKPAVKTLASQIQLKYGESLSYGQVQGYDSMMTLAAAMKKPGALNSRSTLNAAVDTLQNVTPVGGPAGYTFSFQPGAGKQHEAFGAANAYSFVQLLPDGSLGAYNPGS